MATIIWVRPDFLATGATSVGEGSKADGGVLRGSNGDYVGGDFLSEERTSVAGRKEKRCSEGG